MSYLVFLASAEAMKPGLLINSFYDSSTRNSSQDILLTDGDIGTTCEVARKRNMKIVVSSDRRFKDCKWIKEQFSRLDNAILISCGWPYKIPLVLINSFSAAVNCHGSYLPDYRGSRAYMHYWANCSSFYGATIHYLNEEFDDGNILIRAKMKMLPDESHDSVFIRTAELCGHLLHTAILMIESGDKGFVINNEIARYFFKMNPEDFEEHRRINDQRLKEGLTPLLTKHKVLAGKEND